jgi:hypothetical protein
MPSALTVFAFEVVFNQPASELFAGNYQVVRLAVQERAQQILAQLHAKPDNQAKKNLRKLELLRSIVATKPSSASRGQSA